MFNKKETKKEVDLTPLIKTRILDLYRKLKKIYTYVNSGPSNFIAGFELTIDNFPVCYGISLKTKFGERLLFVTENSLRYIEDKYENYINNVTSHSFNHFLEDKNYLFEIRTSPSCSLYPRNTKLTFKEIDLAILEVENLVKLLFKQAIKQEEYIKSIETQLRG